jgi:hypothetical protein
MADSPDVDEFIARLVREVGLGSIAEHKWSAETRFSDHPVFDSLTRFQMLAFLDDAGAVVPELEFAAAETFDDVFRLFKKYAPICADDPAAR